METETLDGQGIDDGSLARSCANDEVNGARKTNGGVIRLERNETQSKELRFSPKTCERLNLTLTGQHWLCQLEDDQHE